MNYKNFDKLCQIVASVVPVRTSVGLHRRIEKHNGLYQMKLDVGMVTHEASVKIILHSAKRGSSGIKGQAPPSSDMI